MTGFVAVLMLSIKSGDKSPCSKKSLLARVVSQDLSLLTRQVNFQVDTPVHKSGGEIPCTLTNGGVESRQALAADQLRNLLGGVGGNDQRDGRRVCTGGASHFREECEILFARGAMN